MVMRAMRSNRPMTLSCWAVTTSIVAALPTKSLLALLQLLKMIAILTHLQTQITTLLIRSAKRSPIDWTVNKTSDLNNQEASSNQRTKLKGDLWQSMQQDHASPTRKVAPASGQLNNPLALVRRTEHIPVLTRNLDHFLKINSRLTKTNGWMRETKTWLEALSRDTPLVAILRAQMGRYLMGQWRHRSQSLGSTHTQIWALLFTKCQSNLCTRACKLGVDCPQIAARRKGAESTNRLFTITAQEIFYSAVDCQLLNLEQGPVDESNMEATTHRRMY